MSRRHGVAIAGAMVALALIGAGLGLRHKFALSSNSSAPQDRISTSQAAVVPAQPAALPGPSPRARVSLAAFLNEEAQRVLEIDADPQRTEERLLSAARSLGAAELSWLAKAAAAPDRDPNERVLAAYLLKLNPTESALEPLRRLALTGTKQPTGAELEVRALALEGLEAQGERARPALTEAVSLRKLHPFLAERARRALAGLGSGETIEAQDRSALRALLQESR